VKKEGPGSTNPAKNSAPPKKNPHAARPKTPEKEGGPRRILTPPRHLKLFKYTRRGPLSCLPRENSPPNGGNISPLGGGSPHPKRGKLLPGKSPQIFPPAVFFVFWCQNPFVTPGPMKRFHKKFPPRVSPGPKPKNLEARKKPFPGGKTPIPPKRRNPEKGPNQTWGLPLSLLARWPPEKKIPWPWPLGGTHGVKKKPGALFVSHKRGV